MTAFASLLLLALPQPPTRAWDRVVDLTFPVSERADYHYTDDYDSPRSRGAHGATDIMVSYGTPVFAAVGGTISIATGMGCGGDWTGDLDSPPSWGYALYLEGEDGRTYRYLHLGRDDGPASEAYADGVTCGTAVVRGEHIGYAGHSGNAHEGAPHLHLEIHDDDVEDPDGDPRINPYPSLQDAEARGDFPEAVGGLQLSPDAVQLTGDWNGDGRSTAGWYDNGTVLLRYQNAAGRPDRTYRYGRPGDVPIVGDWNGDGRQTLGVIRDGRWYLRNSHRGGAADIAFRYGRILSGDYPLAGDWNGDGRDTVGIVRNGEWHLRNSNSGGPGEIVYTYGRVRRGDIPLVGDWTGDGRDTPAIVRNREWHLRYRHRGGPADSAFVYGATGDVPVVGDWNGDGVDTPGVVRDRRWLLRNSNSGGRAQLSFGF